MGKSNAFSADGSCRLALAGYSTFRGSQLRVQRDLLCLPRKGVSGLGSGLNLYRVAALSQTNYFTRAGQSHFQLRAARVAGHAVPHPVVADLVAGGRPNLERGSSSGRPRRRSIAMRARFRRGGLPPARASRASDRRYLWDRNRWRRLSSSCRGRADRASSARAVSAETSDPIFGRPFRLGGRGCDVRDAGYGDHLSLSRRSRRAVRYR